MTFLHSRIYIMYLQEVLGDLQDSHIQPSASCYSELTINLNMQSGNRSKREVIHDCAGSLSAN